MVIVWLCPFGCVILNVVKDLEGIKLNPPS